MNLGRVEDSRLIIAIPEALRQKLGPDGAQALAELLNEARVQTRGDVIEIAASRFGRQLAEEIGGLRAEMHSLIGGLRGDMQSERGSLRSELHSEIGKLRSEMHSEIGKLRSEMHSEFGKVRSEMHSEFGKVRSEMRAFEARITRWMFVFWIGQVGVLLGIFFVFFRT